MTSPLLPTISSKDFGRNFSIQGTFRAFLEGAAPEAGEDDDAAASDMVDDDQG